MNPEPDSPKAEDLLSGELSPQERALASPDEKELANAIRGELKSSGYIPFPEEESRALWHMINRVRVKNKFYRAMLRTMPYAAALLLLLATCLLFLEKNGNEAGSRGRMQRLAGKVENRNGGETRLILPGRESIPLSASSAAITYQEKGEKIRIGERETLQVDQPPGQSAGAPPYHTLVVPYGKRARLQLEDGTRVWLNSGSRLVYPAHFEPGQREVFLSGEAYLEVAPEAGRPFMVWTDALNVQVLGTAFNVSAYPEDTGSSVVLAKGKVILQAAAGGVKKELAPGQQGALERNGKDLVVKDVPLEPYLSWKEGYLLVQQEPLSRIIRKLERYYNLSVRFPEEAAQNVEFSGKLKLSPDPRQVFRAITSLTGISFETASREDTAEKDAAGQDGPSGAGGEGTAGKKPVEKDAAGAPPEE